MLEPKPFRVSKIPILRPKLKTQTYRKCWRTHRRSLRKFNSTCLCSFDMSSKISADFAAIRDWTTHKADEFHDGALVGARKTQEVALSPSLPGRTRLPKLWISKPSMSTLGRQSALIACDQNWGYTVAAAQSNHGRRCHRPGWEVSSGMRATFLSFRQDVSFQGPCL